MRIPVGDLEAPCKGLVLGEFCIRLVLLLFSIFVHAMELPERFLLLVSDVLREQARSPPIGFFVRSALAFPMWFWRSILSWKKTPELFDSDSMETFVIFDDMSANLEALEAAPTQTASVEPVGLSLS
eukprot:CAMPEP_0167807498 /NCGR_PEP_ID=MMETSP0111_2-20121227/22577_1 /TAXON_ID=91324 /ORGANISM="Lotharella globosa, Strain CCCM811" /LENGTH=126 /DNA_ID=CAMNT_0007705389 /DNA_START=124 /DNA_END=501 /DNA_ORIENTATION=-